MTSDGEVYDPDYKESHEEWKAQLIKKHHEDSTSWRPVGGDWLCATKKNRAYNQVVYHL